MPNRILIVDDEPFNLELLDQELGDQGYTIEKACGGEEALEKIASFEPDVILLDYMMPKMNGIEVVQRLKRDERYKGVPVIFLTAKGSQEDKAKGLEAGADDYIVKPFESIELLARVRSMMRIKEMHDALVGWNQKLEDKVRQQVEEIERMSRIRRYLSPQIAEAILASEDDNLFETHRREITVSFLDLRRFTSFSDSAEPEEVIGLLRNYYSEMGKVVFQFEGTIEHFAGDGIMVYFNDPIAREDHAEVAARMALKMQGTMKDLRTDWFKKGYDLDLGMGMATGYATLGTIGFEGRMDYGAVGNVTILASRLCSHSEGGQILTNQKTLSQIEHLVEAEPIGELHLKGFSRAIAAFNIIKFKE
jgi:DNA-binding response OmpR family regulator